MYKHILLFIGVALLSFGGSIAMVGSDAMFPEREEVQAANTITSELTTPEEGDLLVVALFNEQASTTDVRIKRAGSAIDTALVPGEALPLTLGDYDVVLTDTDDYHLIYTGDCDHTGRVAVEKEGTAVCLLALSETAPLGTLTVNNIVINDDLGQALSGEFALVAGDTEIISAIPTRVAAGEFVIQDFGPEGYVTHFDGDCDASGTVHVPVGGRAECTIIHDDVTPTEGVLAITTDAEDGALISDEIMLLVDGEIIDETEPANVVAGTHSIAAYDMHGNELRLSGDCREDGNVLVPAGREAVCTVSSNMLTQREGGSNL